MLSRLCAALSLGCALSQSNLSPNCAINGLPCAPPSWGFTYNLTQSTVIQPGASAGPGFFMPNHTYGLISLDWSVAQGVWFPNASNTNTTTCEATLRENCRLLKAAGKATRCFGYHNTELALQWLESQRALMYDPAYKDYFLQFLPGNPSKQVRALGDRL